MLKIKTLLYIFLTFLSSAYLEATMMHNTSITDQVWKVENVKPFDELILSWNGQRPEKGTFHFYVRIQTETWSPWLLYSSWGSDEQSSFSITFEESSVRVYQDAVEILEGNKATAFEIKIAAEGEARLDAIHALHVYTNGDRSLDTIKIDFNANALYLEVPSLSQISLDHIRSIDLCSPTSTTAVIRYLSNNYAIDPVEFANKVWDKGFDIFGNWVFNVAQASTYLGPRWNCWVERLNGFEAIFQYLQLGTPVVVSVRGPLPGSALPYSKGHLLVVIGYEPLNKKIICMDPAFPSNNETHVCYDQADFMQAWSRRGNIAYVFTFW